MIAMMMLMMEKNVDEVEETHTHTALEFETHCDH